METLKEDFEKADTNKDTNLNLDEFIEFHKYGGMEEEEANSNEFMDDVKYMFKVADKDKDETITFDEYIDYLDNVDEEMKQKEL